MLAIVYGQYKITTTNFAILNSKYFKGMEKSQAQSSIVYALFIEDNQNNLFVLFIRNVTHLRLRISIKLT